MRSARVQAVLAVKGGSNAKSRLSSLLDEAAREALWMSMAEHVLSVLHRVDVIARIHVVSACPKACGLASVHHAACLHDALQAGPAAAYRQAIAAIGREDPLLLINADLPHLHSGAAEAMLEDTSVAVIAPDRWLRGTNALLIPARSEVEPQFGADSLARHLRVVRQAGVPHRIFFDPSIAIDVDTPDDLAELPVWAPTSTPAAKFPLCAE